MGKLELAKNRSAGQELGPDVAMAAGLAECVQSGAVDGAQQLGDIQHPGVLRRLLGRSDGLSDMRCMPAQIRRRYRELRRYVPVRLARDQCPVNVASARVLTDRAPSGHRRAERIKPVALCR